ncbi:MAG: TrmH family RNA methyltransferase [Flavobacteriaceae bacterium]
MQSISSLQNDRIKQLIKLQQRSRSRKQTGMFCIEGIREIERALLGGYQMEHFYRVVPEKTPSEKIETLLEGSEAKTTWVTPKIMEQLCYRTSNQVLAVAHQKKHDLGEIKFSDQGLYLIVEGIEKPGNLGALLRTAGGLGLDGVWIVNKQTDLYHPNCIRNSMGAVFRIPTVVGALEEWRPFFQKENISIIGAALHNQSIPLEQVKFQRPCAIAVGNEAEGLSNALIEECFVLAKIPMANDIDSLNVSVAAAMFMHQALQWS